MPENEVNGSKKPPQKPTNLLKYACDLVINEQHFTRLEISPYYEKHNKEYLEALERKGIVLNKEDLSEKLITDDLIRKVLVPQLNGEKNIKADGRYYQYTYYFAISYKEDGKAYKLVWCCDDNNSHILGIMDCFRIGKYDKE